MRSTIYLLLTPCRKLTPIDVEVVSYDYGLPTNSMVKCISRNYYRR